MSDIADFLIVVLTAVVLGQFVVIALALARLFDRYNELVLVLAGTATVVEREALRDPEPVSDTNLAEVSAAIAQQYEIEALEQERQRLEFLSAVVDPTDGVIPKVDVDWTPDQGEQPEVPVPDPTDGSV